MSDRQTNNNESQELKKKKTETIKYEQTLSEIENISGEGYKGFNAEGLLLTEGSEELVWTIEKDLDNIAFYSEIKAKQRLNNPEDTEIHSDTYEKGKKALDFMRQKESHRSMRKRKNKMEESATRLIKASTTAKAIKSKYGVNNDNLTAKEHFKQLKARIKATLEMYESVHSADRYFAEAVAGNKPDELKLKDRADLTYYKRIHNFYRKESENSDNRSQEEKNYLLEKLSEAQTILNEKTDLFRDKYGEKFVAEFRLEEGQSIDAAFDSTISEQQLATDKETISTEIENALEQYRKNDKVIYSYHNKYNKDGEDPSGTLCFEEQYENNKENLKKLRKENPNSAEIAPLEEKITLQTRIINKKFSTVSKVGDWGSSSSRMPFFLIDYKRKSLKTDDAAKNTAISNNLDDQAALYKENIILDGINSKYLHILSNKRKPIFLNKNYDKNQAGLILKGTNEYKKCMEFSKETYRKQLTNHLSAISLDFVTQSISFEGKISNKEGYDALKNYELITENIKAIKLAIEKLHDSLRVSELFLDYSDLETEFLEKEKEESAKLENAKANIINQYKKSANLPEKETVEFGTAMFLLNKTVLIDNISLEEKDKNDTLIMKRDYFRNTSQDVDIKKAGFEFELKYNNIHNIYYNRYITGNSLTEKILRKNIYNGNKSGDGGLGRGFEGLFKPILLDENGKVLDKYKENDEFNKNLVKAFCEVELPSNPDNDTLQKAYSVRKEFLLDIIDKTAAIDINQDMFTLEHILASEDNFIEYIRLRSLCLNFTSVILNDKVNSLIKKDAENDPVLKAKIERIGLLENLQGQYANILNFEMIQNYSVSDSFINQGMLINEVYKNTIEDLTLGSEIYLNDLVKFDKENAKLLKPGKVSKENNEEIFEINTDSKNLVKEEEDKKEDKKEDKQEDKQENEEKEEIIEINTDSKQLHKEEHKIENKEENKEENKAVKKMTAKEKFSALQKKHDKYKLENIYIRKTKKVEVPPLPLEVKAARFLMMIDVDSLSKATNSDLIHRRDDLLKAEEYLKINKKTIFKQFSDNFYGRDELFTSKFKLLELICLRSKAMEGIDLKNPEYKNLDKKINAARDDYYNHLKEVYNNRVNDKSIKVRGEDNNKFLKTYNKTQLKKYNIFDNLLKITQNPPKNVDPNELERAKNIIKRLQGDNYQIAGGTKGLPGFKEDGRLIPEPLLRSGLLPFFSKPEYNAMSEKDINKWLDDFAAGSGLPTYDELEKMNIPKEEKDAKRKEIDEARERNLNAIDIMVEKAMDYYDRMEELFGYDVITPDAFMANKTLINELTLNIQVLTNLMSNDAIKNRYGKRGERFKQQLSYFMTTEVIGASAQKLIDGRIDLLRKNEKFPFEETYENAMAMRQVNITTKNFLGNIEDLKEFNKLGVDVLTEYVKAKITAPQKRSSAPSPKAKKKLASELTKNVNSYNKEQPVDFSKAKITVNAFLSLDTKDIDISTDALLVANAGKLELLNDYCKNIDKLLESDENALNTIGETASKVLLEKLGKVSDILEYYNAKKALILDSDYQNTKDSDKPYVYTEESKENQKLSLMHARVEMALSKISPKLALKKDAFSDDNQTLLNNKKALKKYKIFLNKDLRPKALRSMALVSSVRQYVGDNPLFKNVGELVAMESIRHFNPREVLTTFKKLKDDPESAEGLKNVKHFIKVHLNYLKNKYGFGINSMTSSEIVNHRREIEEDLKCMSQNLSIIRHCKDKGNGVWTEKDDNEKLLETCIYYEEQAKALITTINNVQNTDKSFIESKIEGQKYLLSVDNKSKEAALGSLSKEVKWETLYDNKSFTIDDFIKVFSDQDAFKQIWQNLKTYAKENKGFKPHWFNIIPVMREFYHSEEEAVNGIEEMLKKEAELYNQDKKPGIHFSSVNFFGTVGTEDQDFINESYFNQGNNSKLLSTAGLSGNEITEYLNILSTCDEAGKELNINDYMNNNMDFEYLIKGGEGTMTTIKEQIITAFENRTEYYKNALQESRNKAQKAQKALSDFRAKHNLFVIEEHNKVYRDVIKKEINEIKSGETFIVSGSKFHTIKSKNENYNLLELLKDKKLKPNTGSMKLREYISSYNSYLKEYTVLSEYIDDIRNVDTDEEFDYKKLPKWKNINCKDKGFLANDLYNKLTVAEENLDDLKSKILNMCN